MKKFNEESLGIYKCPICERKFELFKYCKKYNECRFLPSCFKSDKTEKRCCHNCIPISCKNWKKWKPIINSELQ